MKILLLIMILTFAVSCNNPNQPPRVNSSEGSDIKADNKELRILFKEDQKDRTPESGEINWEVVLVRDSVRLNRTFEIVENQQLQTPNDYYHAATIFQHGYDTIASRMAVEMMQKAIELDSTINKWLLAAAIDRDLQRRGEPQVFGIQFTKNEEGKWVLYDIDTTKIDDKTRKEYGVSSLSELRMQAERMNDNN